MKNRPLKKDESDLTFRLKMGEYEVEISGTREDVTNMIKELPDNIVKIDKAFEKVRPKKVTTLTVKTEPATTLQKPPTQQYPRIAHTQEPEEAALNLLATDWGKWRPRTIDELSEALKTNSMDMPIRSLGAILMELVKKEKVVRWHTNSGYVYILAEKEAIQQSGEGTME